MKLTLRLKGGKGSGDFNHSGRPGQVGGSAPGGGAGKSASIPIGSSVAGGSSSSGVVNDTTKIGTIVKYAGLPKSAILAALPDNYKSVHIQANSYRTGAKHINAAVDIGGGRSIMYQFSLKKSGGVVRPKLSIFPHGKSDSKIDDIRPLLEKARNALKGTETYLEYNIDGKSGSEVL